jgi:osmotically-inducible protein OsmY
MANSENAQNPEISLEAQADQILEQWKSKGTIKIYRDPAPGKMGSSRSASFQYRANDSTVREEIKKALEEGWRYKLD